jgi:hypothetical protein
MDSLDLTLDNNASDKKRYHLIKNKHRKDKKECF